MWDPSWLSPTHHPTMGWAKGVAEAGPSGAQQRACSQVYVRVSKVRINDQDSRKTWMEFLLWLSG